MEAASTRRDIRVGIAVADMQTLHRGHNGLLNEMRMSCDRAIVGLGSVRKHGIPGHPFTFEQRREMIRAIHGDFFDFVALDDIDAGRDIRDWYAYVASKVAAAGLPEPTDCFSGSRIDARWYFHAFADVTDSAVVHGSTSVHSNPHTGRKLHIVNREATGLPSGREVRLLIETRDDEWKRYVPARLHTFVEMEYPPHLRQPIDFDRLRLDAGAWSGVPCSLVKAMQTDSVEKIMSAVGRFPVGTRITGRASLDDFDPGQSRRWAPAFIDGIGKAVLELKDDGKWRPILHEDEKADWAREFFHRMAGC